MSAIALEERTATPAVHRYRTFTTARVRVWIVAVAAVAWVAVFGSSFHLYVGATVLIHAMTALGLDLLMGRTGQVSIGTAGLLLVGGFATGLAAGNSWAPFPVPLIVGAVAGAVTGLVLGLPALRLKGIYLILATLALHEIAHFAGREYQERSGRLSGVSLTTPTVFGWKMQPGRGMFLFLAAVLAILVILLYNLYRRGPGRMWLAIKENEEAASVIGIRVTRWKLFAFVLSSSIIGFAGGLLAYFTLNASYETYSLEIAISFIVMLVVGGLGSIPGAIAGATLITAAPHVVQSLSQRVHSTSGIGKWFTDNVFFLNNGLYGLIVFLFVLYQPAGLAGFARAIGRRSRERSANPVAVVAPTASKPSETERLLVRAVAPEGRNGNADEKAALCVRDLSVRYRGGATAIRDFDIDVYPGSVVAILGRNGAGKTSALRSIAGFFLAEGVRVTGSIELEGNSIAKLSPSARAQAGVVLVPERDKIFASLTVQEHFRIVGASDESIAQVVEMFPMLGERMALPAGLLSGGQRQMLALGVAWIREPKILMIDELSLGLAPAVTNELLRGVREMSRHSNLPILIVEQNATAAAAIADHVYFLEEGCVTRSGSAADIQAQGDAFDALLGEKVAPR